METSRGHAFSIFIQRFATPFTAAIFTVTIVSGVSMFFELKMDFFREMHAWLSVVLLLPIAFHVFKNRIAIVRYFQRGSLYLPLVLALLAASGFGIAAWVKSKRGHRPPPAVMILADASLRDLAPVLRTTPDALIAKLGARGYAAKGNDDTLAAVAQAAHVPVGKVVREMTSNDPNAPDDDD